MPFNSVMTRTPAAGPLVGVERRMLTDVLTGEPSVPKHPLRRKTDRHDVEDVEFRELSGPRMVDVASAYGTWPLPSRMGLLVDVRV